MSLQVASYCVLASSLCSDYVGEPSRLICVPTAREGIPIYLLSFSYLYKLTPSSMVEETVPLVTAHGLFLYLKRDLCK